jgi:hypothetical protein
VQSLTLQGNAQVDIGTGSLAINYGVGNPSPLSSIESELATGYNNGAWSGEGIISSAAAANPGFAIGYADGSVDVGTAVQSGQVLIKYAPIGDVDLDGTVNLTDLLDLLNGFAQSGRDWTQGDVNYDGTVNLTDLLDLLNNYGSTALTTGAQSANDNSIASPAAAVVAYKTASSPFASGPLRLSSSGSVFEQISGAYDADGDILNGGGLDAPLKSGG